MDNFKQINFEDNPTKGAWKLPMLFRKSSTGKTTQWQVGFDGINQLIMEFGQIGGAIRVTNAEVVPKVKRNMQEQAIQEARHRYEEKYNKDAYREQLEEVEDDENEEESSKIENFTQPMLANEWKPEKTKLKFPVWTQAKLDGVRALAFNEKDGVRFRSRNGKEFYFLDNIRKELKDFFKYLPENAILDGEFYSFEHDFNSVVSAVKQTKTPSSYEKDIIYAIFDIILPDNPPFDVRFFILDKAFDIYDANYKGKQVNPINIIDVAVANSKEELIEHHDFYVQEGFEGLIIRKIAGKNPSKEDIKNSQYKFGRGSNLLKYKKFTTEEGVVIDVKESSGTEKGAAVLIIKDIRGNTLPVRFRGSIDLRREWFQNPKLVIGKKATIRYQELTPDGVPRFPVGVAIRDYE